MVSMHRLSLATLLPVVTLFAVFGTRAATVVMENGEAFSGDIIRMTDGNLLLRNRYAGEITLPWSAVTNLISDEPLRLQLPGERVVSGTTKTAAPGRLKVAEVSASEEQSLPLADITAINEPLVNPHEYKWRGKSNVGLNATSGHIRHNALSCRWPRARWKTASFGYKAGVDFNRGSDNAVPPAVVQILDRLR